MTVGATERAIRLRNVVGDSAVVSLYGGQLLSWCTADGGEQFYCSPQSVAGRGGAIRGGVPVCFPQFANRGPLGKHGFARTSTWERAGDALPADSACLTLRDSKFTRSVWPHGFELRLQVVLGAGWLETGLQVLNTGDTSFEFTAALHTYLAVADVRRATLHGLANAPFLDSLHDGARSIGLSAPLEFAGELDRIYLKPPAALELHGRRGPCLRIEQQGFADTVIWNPGPAKAAALGDMPAADWTRMLCIEAAQVETPACLAPGELWQGVQRLTRLPVHQPNNEMT